MALDQEKWAFLPARYHEDWLEPFLAPALDALPDGGQVLDVGAGAKPVITPELRPPSTVYVGLDIDGTEMHKAPAGSYDEVVVADIADPPDELTDRFDVVVSWQVLEHVESMARSIEGARRCLKPGGVFVAQLTGGNAWFALANRVVPDAVAQRAMKRLLKREPDSVFHANYDASTYSKLVELLAAWRSVAIEPRFSGASYLTFSRPLARLYVGVENRLVARDARNWATHYLIVAVK